MAALAALPTSFLVPAVASAGAYINARYGIANDLRYIARFLGFHRNAAALVKADRVSLFYQLEEKAKDPSLASHPFLVLPAGDAEGQVQSQWTYAEAYETVLKYAAWLGQEHGVQRGDVVAMDFTNKPQFLWVWFALWSLGATPAFINTNLRDKAFIHCVKISTARLLVVDSGIKDVLDNGAASELSSEGIQSVVLDSDQEQKILVGAPYRAPDETRSGLRLKDSALLIYTSGTTGLPKAAHVPWEKPIGVSFAVSKILELNRSSRYFTCLPLYHTTAALLNVCCCLGVGNTLVLGAKFSPRTLIKQVAETEATHLQYVGEMCRYLTASPPTPYDKAHKVRVVFGNGLRSDVWQNFKDRFAIDTIVELYGATEGVGIMLNVSRNSFTRGAVGKSALLTGLLNRMSQAILKFDHEADEPWRDPSTGLCKRCDTNEPGELVAALDPKAIEEKFPGYIGNAKATESKILRDVFKKGDAWFRTGDLLRRDADGRTWFVDRIGDTFRWKGENVSTAEVSEVLGTHPAIKEANVYGVELPGHDGRAGCAAVLLEDGEAFTETLGRSLAAHAKKDLPRYAVPLFLRIMKGEFEVTGTMKQTKVKLRNEGVDPEQTGEDQIVWLSDVKSDKGYVSFTKADWQALGSAKVKL